LQIIFPFIPTISYRLHCGQSQSPVLEIVPDASGLYRIAWRDIGLSDLVTGVGLNEKFS
jgi:hypothetical protein